MANSHYRSQYVYNNSAGFIQLRCNSYSIFFIFGLWKVVGTFKMTIILTFTTVGPLWGTLLLIVLFSSLIGSDSLLLSLNFERKLSFVSCSNLLFSSGKNLTMRRAFKPHVQPIIIESQPLLNLHNSIPPNQMYCLKSRLYATKSAHNGKPLIQKTFTVNVW